MVCFPTFNINSAECLACLARAAGGSGDRIALEAAALTLPSPPRMRQIKLRRIDAWRKIAAMLHRAVAA
jgi:hypothetical protein